MKTAAAPSAFMMAPSSARMSRIDAVHERAPTALSTTAARVAGCARPATILPEAIAGVQARAKTVLGPLPTVAFHPNSVARRPSRRR